MLIQEDLFSKKPKKITKKLRKQFIRKKLSTDKQWAEKAIIKLYHCQTDEEQWVEETRLKNGVGFNAIDAQLLSSFAKDIEKYGKLTHRQIKWAFCKLPKYCNQILNISNIEKLDKQIIDNYIIQ